MRSEWNGRAGEQPNQRPPLGDSLASNPSIAHEQFLHQSVPSAACLSERVERAESLSSWWCFFSCSLVISYRQFEDLERTCKPLMCIDGHAFSSSFADVSFSSAYCVLWYKSHCCPCETVFETSLIVGSGWSFNASAAELENRYPWYRTELTMQP